MKHKSEDYKISAVEYYLVGVKHYFKTFLSLFFCFF